MNQPDAILTRLEPPPGGWERLRARRDAVRRWAPSWWAFASGSAAALAWLAIAPGGSPIQMQLSGARLMGQRSQGVELQILENGRAIPLSSADPNVRIYLVESTDPEPTGSATGRAQP